MTPADASPLAIMLCALAFLVGGTAKGAIGAGLPAVAVPVMVTVIEPALAVALTVVPVGLANLWQTLHRGHYRTVVRRFWPFVLAFTAGVALGAQALVAIDAKTMSLAIGVLVVVSALLQWRIRDICIPEQLASRINPIAGLICGAIGGATAIFVPVVVYLAALRPPKDHFVVQMSLSMTCGSIPLYGTLIVSRVLSWNELALSAAAFAPVAVGLTAGTWLRGKLAQETFERILLVAMSLLGATLIVKGLR